MALLLLFFNIVLNVRYSKEWVKRIIMEQTNTTNSLGRGVKIRQRERSPFSHLLCGRIVLDEDPTALSTLFSLSVKKVLKMRSPIG